MLKNIKGIAIGASVVAGVSAISGPALAATFTATGDITVFEETISGITEQTYSGDASAYQGDLGTVLTGTSIASDGNLELQNNTDNLTIEDFWSPTAPVATLDADFGDGTSIEFSSLTGEDWFGTFVSGVSNPLRPSYYGANDFANEWFDAALEAHGATIDAVAEETGIAALAQANNVSVNEVIFNQMVGNNVFQRFSDPNIAYVENDNGLVTFGLAGHKSAGNLFANDPLKPLFDLLTASEVVKVSYNGTDPVYAYSFERPFDSGVVNEEDDISHNGTFEFTIDENNEVIAKRATVPEPSAVLGLMAVGGLLTVCKRKSRKA